ncbi:hypothetical protein AB7M16_002016 [Bradyrhizobium sp. USDA 372]
MKYSKITLAIASAAVIASMAPARADGLIICKAALSALPAAAGCAAVGVVVHELLLAERPFGPNGELMRIVAAPVKIVDGNIKASMRESGEGAKVLRAVAGISWRDIEAHGVFGGSNSIFRKPLGVH